MKDFEFRDLIERVRERVDIAEVIGEHVILDRHYKALCPFHKERTPSFSVNQRGRYFYCFGCKVGGDVFRFLELYEGKSFMEVLSELAVRVGIPIPSLTEGDRERLREMRTIEDILTEAAQFYHENLTQEARDYLKERDFSEETISRFRIGYANGRLWEYLLGECRFPPDLCLRAGVLKDVGGVPRDYFRQRIIFPNLRRGRVVHMTGRSLDGREPKYLHLPGEIRYLYNEDALANKVVYLVEGVPDCLSAVQLGYPAVALYGASNFKEEYLSKLKGCETVYLCLDGDKAGERGALKIGELIGERARIVQLPHGLDLNDYLREHSKEDFEALVAASKDVIEYELGLIPPDVDKTALPKLLDPILKRFALMEGPRVEAYLSYKIKPRFSLTRDDIAAYREAIKRYRKAEGAPTLFTPKCEPLYTALFDGLVDLVEGDGGPAFLIKDGEELSIRYQVELKGVIYVPPPRDNIPWLLPRAREVMNYYHSDGDGELYEALLAHHQAISELPGEEYYDLIVAWDFHTYLAERFQYSPIICLYAVPERGKTRTGKGMIHVAYRGLRVESPRDAYLVRVAHNLRASLFFDMRSPWKKMVEAKSDDILLNRFEKGMTVARVNNPDRGAHRDIDYYEVFGPTVIGTNEKLDNILETRAIYIHMPPSRSRFENDVTPALCLPYKERLVAFRARHLGSEPPPTHKAADGRLGDILRPLHQIIRLVRPEREEAFLGLVKQIEEERLTERVDSPEGQIIETVIRLRGEAVGGRLPIKLITNAFNADKPEREQVSPRWIGYRLGAIGFKKVRGSDGAHAIVWDDELITQLKQAYGVCV